MSNETTTLEDLTISERVRQNPQPAILWGCAFLVLLILELGAVTDFILNSFPWETVGSYIPSFLATPVAGFAEQVAALPTLLTRDLISNQGYHLPNQGWQETFMGLSPAYAWLIRVVLIYVYALAWLILFWMGYTLYRNNYRVADWTPTDDTISRFRSHKWGLFGVIVVFLFVVMALFAPAIGTTTVEQNIQKPFSYSFQYYDESAGELKETTVGNANFASGSKGTPTQNVGLMSYDKFNRFHPFGTLPKGKDMFTFLAAGARISLSIAVVSIIFSGFIAIGLAVLTAYYKGITDLIVVITGDSIQSIPQLLLLILLAQLLSGTWVGQLYNGAFILAIIFVLTGWPALWRAVRGPALQIAEQEWVDAAQSFGQTPRKIMQKHMVPYVIGYLLIYASLTLGGIIIGVAGLSFLGLGITAPTPEWGRAINMGQPYVTTVSWHMSLIPGILIVILVTGFNALGDGIRDAIDPQAESTGESEVAAGGGA